MSPPPCRDGWRASPASPPASRWLSTAEGLGAGVVHVAIAAIGIAAPLAVAVFMGDRSKVILDGWRDWLAANNATVLAVLFAVIGTVLIGKGMTVRLG